MLTPASTQILHLFGFIDICVQTLCAALCLLMGQDPTLSSPLGAALRRYSCCTSQHMGCGVRWGVASGGVFLGGGPPRVGLAVEM